MEQWTGSKLEKEHIKASLSPSRLILSLCLFNLYTEYIMRNAGLEEEIAGININDLRYADDNHPYGRKQRTKEPLDESERGE